jgi:hypothetical protein
MSPARADGRSQDKSGPARPSLIEALSSGSDRTARAANRTAMQGSRVLIYQYREIWYCRKTSGRWRGCGPDLAQKAPSPARQGVYLGVLSLRCYVSIVISYIY